MVRPNYPQAMPSSTQRDLFESEAQPELSAADAAPPAYRSDPDQVRARLQAILAEARAPEKLPWDRDKLLGYRTIFPQMAGWLPDEEGALRHPLLFGGSLRAVAWQSSGANKKRVARLRSLILTRAAGEDEERRAASLLRIFRGLTCVDSAWTAGSSPAVTR